MLDLNLNIRVSKELLEEIDDILKEGFFRYRSEYIRHAIVQSNKAYKKNYEKN